MPHCKKCGATVAEGVVSCHRVRSTWRRARDVFDGRSNTSRRAANSSRGLVSQAHKVRFSRVRTCEAGQDAIGNPRT